VQTEVVKRIVYKFRFIFLIMDKKEVFGNNKIKKKNWGRKVKVSQGFVTALSIVSILGFIGIVSETLFGTDLRFYVEAFLMIVIGVGLNMEAQYDKIRSISKEGLNKDNFTNLTTIIIGDVAIIAGIFSFPLLRIDNPSFLAVKGIISIVAIVIIVIQTWIIDRREI
jgi:hypothetical protein